MTYCIYNTQIGLYKNIRVSAKDRNFNYFQVTYILNALNNLIYTDILWWINGL